MLKIYESLEQGSSLLSERHHIHYFIFKFHTVTSDLEKKAHYVGKKHYSWDFFSVTPLKYFLLPILDHLANNEIKPKVFVILLA